MQHDNVEPMLTDAEWAQVNTMLPVPCRRGGPYDNRAILEAVIWIARNRVTWAALPERFPLYQAVYGRFRKWQAAGVIQPVLDSLGVPMPEPQRAGAKKRTPVTAAQRGEGLAAWLFPEAASARHCPAVS